MASLSKKDLFFSSAAINSDVSATKTVINLLIGHVEKKEKQERIMSILGLLQYRVGKQVVAISNGYSN